MKRLIYGVCFLALLGILAACSGGNENAEPTTSPAPAEQPAPAAEPPVTEPAPTGDAADAQAKFEQSCAKCHGVDLISGKAPDLNVIGSKYTQEEILGIITNGRGKMPAGQLTGADAEAVAAWLAEKK